MPDEISCSVTDEPFEIIQTVKFRIEIPTMILEMLGNPETNMQVEGLINRLNEPKLGLKSFSALTG